MKALLAIVLAISITSTLAAQETKADKYRASIDKGLAWLVQQQAEDGSWAESRGHMSTAMTAFAGMALLADGNTLTDGKYAANVRRAMNWYLKQHPQDLKYQGVLGDMDHPDNTGRYMSQHGVALSFLAQLYGEIDKAEERATVRKALTGAITFAIKGQAGPGGWFYTSAIEGHNSTENVTTMLVLQGLLDARNAGIAVPRDPLKHAHRYLQACTAKDGSILYSGSPRNPPAQMTGGGRPTITAMALAAFLPHQDRYDETTRRWLVFCAENKILAVARVRQSGDLLPHLYFSKVAYHVNQERWHAAFPDKEFPDQLNWAKYRTTLFDYLHSEQDKDGSWPTKAWTLGPVFNTCVALNILLYENSLRHPLSR